MDNSKAIFIAEVRKRLAKKRKLQMRKTPKIIDQIPLEKINYNRKSLLLSYKDFKNNQKYIENFIREKSYKSILRKSTIIKKNKINFLTKDSITKNNNNNISKIIKYKSNTLNCNRINIKKNILKIPKKTPFQIGLIKTQYLREYINNSQKNNLNNNIKEESSIQSFSINKYNVRKKVFGKTLSANKKCILRKNKIFDFNNLSHKNNGSKCKINYQLKKVNNLNKKEKNDFDNNTLKIVKVNCYFNKLNLNKINKKISTNENSI